MLHLTVFVVVALYLIHGNDQFAYATPKGLVVRAQSMDRILIKTPPERRFKLCPNTKGVNLRNAAWFSYLSGNQYSHFGKLSRSLADIGLVDHEMASLYEKRALIIQAEKERLKLAPPKNLGSRLDSEDIKSLSIQQLREEYQDVLPSIETDDQLRAALMAVIELNEKTPIETRESALAYYKSLFLTDILNEDLQFFSGKEVQNPQPCKSRVNQAMWIKVPNEPIAIISFRGTEADEFDEIKADLNIVQKPLNWPEFENAKVHCGFLNAFEEIDSLLIEKIKTLDAHTKVYITGHSMGGALGSLLVAKLISLGLADHIGGLYLFGSPRVGDAVFAEGMNQFSIDHEVPLLHLSVEGDPVASLPVPFLQSQYRHFGSHVIIPQTSNDPLEIIQGEYNYGRVNLLNPFKPHDIREIHQSILGRIQSQEQMSCPLANQTTILPLIEELSSGANFFGDGF